MMTPIEIHKLPFADILLRSTRLILGYLHQPAPIES